MSELAKEVEAVLPQFSVKGNYELVGGTDVELTLREGSNFILLARKLHYPTPFTRNRQVTQSF